VTIKNKGKKKFDEKKSYKTFNCPVYIKATVQKKKILPELGLVPSEEKTPPPPQVVVVGVWVGNPGASTEGVRIGHLYEGSCSSGQTESRYRQGGRFQGVGEGMMQENVLPYVIDPHSKLGDELFVTIRVAAKKGDSERNRSRLKFRRTSRSRYIGKERRWVRAKPRKK